MSQGARYIESDPRAVGGMQLQSSGSRGGVAKEFSVFVGNLDLDTPVAEMEELLYELFLQVMSFIQLTNEIAAHFLVPHRLVPSPTYTFHSTGILVDTSAMVL